VEGEEGGEEGETFWRLRPMHISHRMRTELQRCHSARFWFYFMNENGEEKGRNTHAMTTQGKGGGEGNLCGYSNFSSFRRGRRKRRRGRTLLLEPGKGGEGSSRVEKAYLPGSGIEGRKKKENEEGKTFVTGSSVGGKGGGKAMLRDLRRRGCPPRGRGKKS